MKKYIKLMRMHHYIKNFLIFVPCFFSGKLFDIQLLIKLLFSFISFSLISSVIYIVNDIQDVESDRKHSVKCKRPIASGAVSIKKAWLLAGVIFILSLVFQYFAQKGQQNLFGWICPFLYFILNLGYSNGLKNVPIIDITILSSGFLLRVLYGSFITGIEISNWLYLTVISMSFYLALGKRRNELKWQKEQSRKVMKYYNYDFLDKNMYVCLALIIMFYSLWTVDPLTISRISRDYLIWTVPFIIIICMRYSLNVEGGSDGDPVEVLLKDKMLVILTILFAVATMVMIYV